MSSPFDLDERTRLAALVVGILDEWRLTPEEQLNLLGMAGAKGRTLTRYRNGAPLPEEPELLERVRRLVGIWEALQRNNPMNPGAGFLWLKHRNKYFPDRTPLQVMLEEGLLGLQYVWVRLDCTQGWD